MLIFYCYFVTTIVITLINFANLAIAHLNMRFRSSMHTLKIRQIGNSLGAVFPKELLQKLNIQEGDKIYLTETPDGVRITPYDPEFEAAMQANEVGKI